MNTMQGTKARRHGGTKGTGRGSFSRFSLLASHVPLLLLLTGCAVDQSKEVSIYRSVLDEGAPATTLPSAQPIEAHQTLALIDALALANRDNERLSMRGEDYLQALIDKDRVFAEFLPTITFSPQYVQNERFKLPPGVPSGLFPMHPLDVPVNARADVFNGFRDIARLRAAARTVEQQKLLLLDLRASILLEVAQVYYSILKAEQSAQVLASSVSTQEARVVDVQNKIKQGLARQLDLEQSRARAADARVQLTSAKNGAVKGRATLATLIGVPYVEGKLVDQFPTPKSIAALDEWVARARARRRDLLAAEQAILAARQGVEAAFAQYYPSVSLNLEGFLHRESFPEDSMAMAVVNLNFPLFTGGRIHADVRAAWSRFRQAVMARSLLARQVAEQVKIAHADFSASLKRLEDLKTEEAAAREALRIANNMYDQGMATNLDRLDAQDRIQAAALQYVAEGFDATVYYLQLLRATAGLEEQVGSRQ